VTASRHLSKIFDTVWRLGPFKTPSHHASCRSWPHAAYDFAMVQNRVRIWNGNCVSAALPPPVCSNGNGTNVSSVSTNARGSSVSKTAAWLSETWSAQEERRTPSQERGQTRRDLKHGPRSNTQRNSKLARTVRKPANAPCDGGRVWLITGISRGVGRAIIEATLNSSDDVVGTVRGNHSTNNELSSNRLHTIRLDVTEALAMPSAITEACRMMRDGRDFPTRFTLD
jgi:hypothetical protein